MKLLKFISLSRVSVLTGTVLITLSACVKHPEKAKPVEISIPDFALPDPTVPDLSGLQKQLDQQKGDINKLVDSINFPERTEAEVLAANKSVMSTEEKLQSLGFRLIKSEDTVGNKKIVSFNFDETFYLKKQQELLSVGEDSKEEGISETRQISILANDQQIFNMINAFRSQLVEQILLFGQYTQVTKDGQKTRINKPQSWIDERVAKGYALKESLDAFKLTDQQQKLLEEGSTKTGTSQAEVKE